MKDSEIVRRAAKLQSGKDSRLSCRCLWKIQTMTKNNRLCRGGIDRYKLSREYAAIFSPKKKKVHEWSYWLDDQDMTIAELQNWRVLALLFFAEILESEGR